MRGFWLCCEDLNRNQEDQRVAFGPFKTKREARAFGWALSYSDLEGGTYCEFGVRKTDEVADRLVIQIDPEKRVETLTHNQWDARLVWPETPADDDSDETCRADETCQAARDALRWLRP